MIGPILEKRIRSSHDHFDYREVPRIREERECSLFEAKAIVEKEQLLDVIAVAKRNGDVELLCDVLEFLVSKYNIVR